MKGVAPGPTMLLPAEEVRNLPLVFALVWVHRVRQRHRRAHRSWLAQPGSRVCAACVRPFVSRDPDVRSHRHRRRTARHGGPGRTVDARRTGLCDVGAQVAEVAADACVRARPFVERQSSCRTRSTAGRGCCARQSWCSRRLPSRYSWPGAARASVEQVPNPTARATSALRADVLMSACFAAAGAAGLALSLSLTGRPSVFPRIAFGATFGLALLQLALSWRKARSDQPAQRPTGAKRQASRSESPGSYVSSPTPGSSAWSSAPAVSALVYLRIGRERIVANDDRDDRGPSRADVGARRPASAAVRPRRVSRLRLSRMRCPTAGTRRSRSRCAPRS